MEKLIKSPLNYTGNKYKLLPQILPLLPKDINCFYDLFGGSGTVLFNCKAVEYIYNEINPLIKELVEYIATCNCDTELDCIDKTIIVNDLGKEHKEQYYKFRELYNKNQNPRDLFILSCFSLNYQLRFNKSGKFNMTSGNRGFSANMRNNFVDFNNFAKIHNIKYENKSYMDFVEFKTDDFVYLDPPYLPTVTSYTENGLWNPQKEKELYSYLDILTNKNIKWALSNISVYRGLENKILNEWSSKYNIHKLNHKYNNNNCWKKDNTTQTQEVLITNY